MPKANVAFDSLTGCRHEKKRCFRHACEHLDSLFGRSPRHNHSKNLTEDVDLCLVKCCFELYPFRDVCQNANGRFECAFRSAKDGKEHFGLRVILKSVFNRIHITISEFMDTNL